MVFNYSVYSQTQPSSLNVVGKSDKQITIRWHYVSGQDYYDVLRAENPIGVYTPIAENLHVTSSQFAIYTDAGLSPKTEYCYKVRIAGSTGSSPNICETTFSPDPPLTFTITGSVSNGGAPVEGVTVIFYHQNYTYRTTSESDGNYVLSNISQGLSGKLYAEKSGCTISTEYQIVDIQENLLNKDFNGANCPVSYYMNIVSPAINDVWLTENVYTIQYLTNIEDSRISIKLVDENLNLIKEITPSSIPDGDYIWSPIPSNISNGNYYIIIEGLASSTLGQSGLFVIQNNIVVGNDPPCLQFGNVNPKLGIEGSTFTFSCTWNDIDGDYIVGVKNRFRLENGFWNDVDLNFVPGTNPPQFSGQEQINQAGNYQYQFQAADDEEPSGTNPIHQPIWKDAGSFVVTSTEPDGNCTFPDLILSHPAYEAIQYLCELGIVNGDDETGNVRPDVEINRAELAKLAYTSIELDKSAYADNFPCPYNDLQDAKDAWYFSYAKNLLYLEFNNGVAPFDKNQFNFYPSKTISRAHTLKVLLETWNIELKTGSNIFIDVSENHDAYIYIYTAYQLGLLQQTVRPDDKCSRSEAFGFLYKLMTNTNLSVPIVGVEDFYIPDNITPENFGQPKDFSFPYSKQSFYISGTNIPLVFGHKYQPHSYNFQKELLKLKPLGTNWTHSYNCYLIEIKGDSTRKKYDDRVVIAFPNGSFNSFQLLNGEYQSITKGVFSNLNKISPVQYNFVSRDKITYSFVKIKGTNDEFPFVLTSISDRNNNIITISWENSFTGSSGKRISQVTGTAGRSFLFDYYPSSDLLKEVTDPIKRKIKFSYDDASLGDNARLFGFTDAKSQITMYQYLVEGEAKYLLQGIILPKGNYIGAGYEGRKLKSITSGEEVFNLERIPNYENISASNYLTLKITDRNSKELGTSTYDKGNNLRSHSAFGNNIQIDYDNIYSTIPKNITADGVQSTLEIDIRGNIIKTTINGIVHEYSYDLFDNLVSYTDPEQNRYEWIYDFVGNLISYKTPLGETVYTLNSKGQPVSVRNPEGIINRFEYDNWWNINRSIAPEGIESKTTYDDVGRIKSLVKPNGQTVTYNYDNNNNLLDVMDITKLVYGYDPNDNLTSITNVMNQISTLVYSEEEDYLENFNYGGMDKAMTFDAKGRLSTYTDPKNQLFTYSYNTKDLLENIEGMTKNLHYAYNGRNKIKQVDYNGQSSGIIYDNLDRVDNTTDIFNNTVSYTYNNNNQKKSIFYPGGGVVYYSYENNLLSKVKHWLGEITYTYRKDGLIQGINYPNNTTGSYKYDAAGRTIGLVWLKANGDTIYSSLYELDPVGLALKEYRRSVFDLDTISVEETEIVYTHDNSNNQILTAEGTIYQHDLNGNISNKGNATYIWDEYNRLIETPDFTFTYDGFGNRKQKINKANGKTTRYILDINVGMSKVIAVTDQNNQIQEYYIYGQGLLSRINATGNVSYYHFDMRGNIVAITDQNGNITHRYEYSPYGQIIAIEETDNNPFRFVGQYGVMYEADDLYFMRARYYDPKIGRFLNTDPIFDAKNLFVYVDNNPITQIDPKGTSFFDVYNKARSVAHSDPDRPVKTLYDIATMGKKANSFIEDFDESFDNIKLLAKGKMSAGEYTKSLKVKASNKSALVSMGISGTGKLIDIIYSINEGEFDIIMVPKAIGSTALEGVIALSGFGLLSSAVETFTGVKPSDWLFDTAEQFGTSFGSDLYDLIH